MRRLTLPRVPRRRLIISITVALLLVVWLCLTAIRIVSIRQKRATAAAEPISTPMPTLALPTATSPPANTPVPTLLPNAVTVEGPEKYPATFPYLAEYTLSLLRGQRVELSVTCDRCLWKNGTTTPLTLTLTTEERTKTFTVVVMAGDQAHFALVSNGAECTTWELGPGDKEAILKTMCALP